jgi:S-DNA-T family DNA segregation ATPase FtsK/SpoIIIE
VTAADDATLADVLSALHAELALPAGTLFAGAAPLPATTQLWSAALRHGAVLGLGAPGAGPGGGSRGGALELHVVGGPDAGRVLPLGQGEIVLGRGAGCSVALSDPAVSRRHVRIAVGDGRVTAADLGSANGTLLRTGAGSATVGTGPTPWPVDSVLTAGSTAVRLTGPRGIPLTRRPASGGRERVRPLPVATAVAATVGSTVEFPAEPAPRAGRRLGWVAVAVPAVAGLLMAWLLDAPQFLFFALLSPVVAITGWVSDRWSGRRDRRRSATAHAAATAAAEVRLLAAVSTATAALDEVHPDLATLAAAVQRRSSPLWCRSGGTPGALTVRLGLGPGPTPVVRVSPDGERAPVVADHVPVTVDLAAAGLGVVGPRTPAVGVVRSLLLQVTALLPPGELGIVVAAAPDRIADWGWAAWLPHLVGVVPCGGCGPADAGELSELLSAPQRSPGSRVGGAPPTRLVVLDGEPPEELLAAVTAQERVVCVAIAATETGLAMIPGACLTVSGETGVLGRLRQRGHPVDRELTLDTAPLAVVTATARALAGLAAPTPTGGLPDSCRLLDLPGARSGRHPARSSPPGWSRDRGALVCVLGQDEHGPVALDLCAQGPHALVAGTTGAGKSELLQTLVTGLALHQPPDRVTFLLIDYKGGAAFAELAELPHTVGLLTDLDPQSTGRALRSLGAELSRRERVLAAHGVRDVADLAADTALPRLVIAVDEFATLVDDLPGFVSGLVGIAQRGRSLGVHLVLATQRPSGVVSPEIRANCSLRICLRTTDETDSRDVLGTPVAAFLPVRRPGRAYLRTGSAPPVLLQVARVSGSPEHRSTGGVRVRRRAWPPAPDAVPPAEPLTGTPVTDLARVVDVLRTRAEQGRLPATGRPWLPPLPDRLSAADLDRRAAPDDPDTRLRIGLLDSPDTQSQDPLHLDLVEGGGWLVVGGPRSGRTTALRAVLREAVHHLAPDRLEVHVLDHGGGGLAAEAARLPHTGTTVDRADPQRSERLIIRLQSAVDQRRAGATAAPAQVLLLVDGVESLLTQLDDADPGSGSAALLRLVREGAAAGLTCVLSADRVVPGSRLAAAASARLVLPLPDRADYAVAGVPPRAVPGTRPPGRALFGEDAAECQLVLPRETAAGTGPAASWATRRAGRTICVVALPTDPVQELPATPADQGSLWLPVGPGGDEGTTVGLDLLRSGGLLVVGPPGSGRTSALTAFARHCRHSGARVLHLASGAGTDPRVGACIALDDVAALRSWATTEPERPAVVVADDVTSLPDTMADALGALGRPGGNLPILVAGAAPELAGAFRGPTVALRRSRTALLLRPTPGDGQLLGLRLPRAPLPARPGSGWLVVGGAVTRLQVARHRVPPRLDRRTGSATETPGTPGTG